MSQPERPVQTQELLQLQREGLLVVDTRSPSEYRQGHLPGAVSLPLFDDAERAEVGTLYKQVDPRSAMLRGLEIVGPKLAGLVLEADELVGRPGRLGLYCWRGGQRSSSLSWLLRQAGHEVLRLEGGYKAYRSYIRAQLDALPFRFQVIDGLTGSGKTQLLHELAQQGAQVLDLEAIACHRGSSFGLQPGAIQPSTEAAENAIHAQLSAFDPQRPVFVENESRNIGRVFLPEGINLALAAGHRIEVIVPLEARLDHLVADYGNYPPELLQAAFVRLRKRLGAAATQEALRALDQGELRTAASIALRYYDKCYRHYSQRQAPRTQERFEATPTAFPALAAELIASR